MRTLCHPGPPLTLLAGALAARGGTQVPTGLGTGGHQAPCAILCPHQHHPGAAVWGGRGCCEGGCCPVPPLPAAHIHTPQHSVPITPLTPCPPPAVPPSPTCGVPAGLQVAGLALQGLPGAGLAPVLGWGVGAPPAAAPHPSLALGVAGGPGAPRSPATGHWGGQRDGGTAGTPIPTGCNVPHHGAHHHNAPRTEPPQQRGSCGGWYLGRRAGSRSGRRSGGAGRSPPAGRPAAGPAAGR